MGTESYTYLGRNFSQLSINDASSSSAFSDCNSDRSGEFATASSQTRRFLITCATENSDDLIRQLVADLHSASLDDQKQAAMEIRLLAKNKPENRVKIAKAGAIKPLISLISSSDLQLQEYGVTAILNLSLCDENKEAIASAGAIKPLVRALSTGTATAKENAACALLRLSQVEENKAAIGRSGAIPPLVSLLASGGFRAKKDASTALYSLCTVKENKLRAVKAGIMKVLVSVPEARAALVEEGGVPVPRDRVVNKEPSSASNHTRVSGTSYEDKALNKSNHSSNGVASAPKVSGGSPRENLSSPVKGEGVVHSNYTASLVKKKKNGNKEMDSGVEDEKIEALIKCDFFDGEWIKDDSYPLYAPGSCNLIDEQFSCIQNGRPDKDYQKYKWKPKGCSLPRLDGHRMLEMLRGKRLIFVGDSLNRNMWESLICILRNSVKDKSKVYEANGRVRFKGEASYSFIFKDYNFSAELFVSPFLVQEWQVQVKNGTKKETLRLDLVGKSSVQYKNADIIIFNTGHWWTHDKTSKGKDYYQEGSHVYNELNVLEAFRRAITTWSRWIDASIDSSKSMIFFRGYSASHFSGGQWNSGGQCDSETVPIKNDKYLKEYPPKMRVLEKVLKYMKTKVTYLNVTKMTDFRKDGHPSIYRKQNLSAEERKSPLSFQDCSHWCLPGVPDAWNEILYAELLLRQYQNQHLKNRT